MEFELLVHSVQVEVAFLRNTASKSREWYKDLTIFRILKVYLVDTIKIRLRRES